MKNNIFQNYVDTIDYALKNGKQRGSFQKAQGVSNFTGDIGSVNYVNESKKLFANYTKEKDLEFFDSLKPLSIISGVKAKYHEKLGQHPDFSHLKEKNSTENHYAVSLFIDIKNSTGLFRKFYPDTVAYITTTIQKAAIHTCWYFGGYVQRLHGDGLLVYFGNKNTSKDVACSNALSAASIFSYFVKEDLKRVFDERGVKNITTRIGIDLGHNEDVLWHLAGMGECSEVTTCSLHTSLAFKMQSSASTNGIIVGDNVKDSMSAIKTTLFTYKKYKTEDGEEDYIFEIPEDKFYYSQWSFDWFNYLKTWKTIEEVDGKLYFIVEPKKEPIKPAAPIIVPQKDYGALEKLAQQNKPWSK